ncbi:hypothetical protein [Halioglobus maricola]|uniref:hypothetical protein n=1 Tax=Halioglobus maricola TaxID=2601894 RepID=UPI001293BCD9|nr:hypothetical protein [Halioglobus maricola]
MLYVEDLLLLLGALVEALAAVDFGFALLFGRDEAALALVEPFAATACSGAS